MARYEELVVLDLIAPTGEPGSPVIPSFVLADLPDATVNTGKMVFVTDATPANLAISDGTNWIAVDDGTTIA